MGTPTAHTAADPTTLASLVRVRAAQRPDAVAIIHGEHQLTYAELYVGACRTANGLRHDGVTKGDRVAYLGRTGLEYFHVLFGAALIGAVTVAINWRLSPKEVCFILDDSDATVLVAGVELLARLEGATATTQIRQVHTIGDSTAVTDFSTWRDTFPDDDPAVSTGSEDACLQLYSSGTTGKPKGVLLSNRSVFDGAPVSAHDLGLTTRTVLLVPLPLFHIVGTGLSLAAMYCGGSAVLMTDADPEAIVRAIAERRVTHAMLVPSLIRTVLDVPELASADLSSLELMIYGASPISETILRRCVEAFGCGMAQGYGLTETAGGVVTLRPEDHVLGGPNTHRLRSAGRPNSNVELRVMDTTSAEMCLPGVTGEIWVRTGQIMLGYWKQPDATSEVLTPDGWFRTGDLGFVDDDGYVYLQDRLKDMIISGGENIYPAEVENVLMSHPAVADVAVIGVPSEQWGETPKAIVVTRPGLQVTSEDLIAACRAELAHYKCPSSVEFVENLPRNPSGKVLKRELRSAYWKGHDRAVG